MNWLHYLSVPPKAALAVISMLRDANLVSKARVVMEKPFGTDPVSAIALNSQVHETFAEQQIFRIDHFLGKEAAQNIPETLGLDRRAGFYESTGAYKDMVVTHLLQVLAFVAMEPPTALEPRSISEEKNKVFRSMLPIDPSDVVRGQFSGYRLEDGVARDSDTETFIALRAGIDNWRWAGVSFYLDAMRGDHTLFATADGIESLWERSIPLLEDPPPVKPYAPGTWGPNAIHQLIAPHAWRLPFERMWREKR